MIVSRGLMLLPAFLLLLPGAACDTTGPGDSLTVLPDSNLSYSRHIEPIFQTSCVLSGCHVGSDAPRGLDLSPPSYNALRNHLPPLVVAGEGSTSLLVQFLDGRMTPRMPLNLPPLTENQLRGIRTWIDEGALNN